MKRLRVAVVVGVPLTLALVLGQATVQAAPKGITAPKGSKFRPLATSVVLAGRGDQGGRAGFEDAVQVRVQGLGRSCGKRAA